jgi:[ribosomal protein S18]-alanine N-acetyltransferase
MNEYPLGKKKIRLRPMGLMDIDPVYAIDLLCFSLPWTKRSYHFELTENPNSSSWVAEIVDEEAKLSIAGMVVSWFIIDEIHIATLAVHPDHRQHGLGQYLLAQALLQGMDQGAKIALLEVRRSNLGAQALYRKFGFREVGIRGHYYQDNDEDALLLNLDPMDRDHIQQFVGSEWKNYSKLD